LRSHFSVKLIHASQIASSDLQAPMNTNLAIDRSNSAPSATTNHIGEITRPTFTPVQSSPAMPLTNGTSKGKGLQLGANKVPSSVSMGMLADQLAEEAAATASLEGNPWGTEDLMDVNADEDDWSELAALCIKLG